MISLSPVIMTNFFQFGKNSALNLEVVIIFKGQISKLHILAANPLRHSRNKNMVPCSNLAKSIKISYYFQENRIGLPGVTLVLCRLCRIYTSQINIYLFAKSHHLLNAHQP